LFFHTNILELSVQGPDPAMASLLANSIGQHAIASIGNLYQVYDISVLDPASAPSKPVSPQPLRDAGLATVLGLMIGATLAILREQIRIPLDAYRQRTILDHDSSAYTRRYFMRLLEEELSHNEKETLSLGLVQLNGLRDLVDTLPQPVVQRLLRQVTSTLRKELRGNDVVGRWGGAQFSIMLPSTSEQAAAEPWNGSIHPERTCSDCRCK
jgi:PleD family two-component response regulator